MPDILASLKAHGASWFLYIGGNDTAETVRIVSEEAAKESYDLRSIHIPKTIDNDLMENHHAPGLSLGSAVRGPGPCHARFRTSRSASSPRSSSSSTVITAISLAPASNGIAAATARAVCGVGFQGIATLSVISANGAPMLGINSGRPVSTNTASRVEGAVACSAVPRAATIRSAVKPYWAIQRGSSPVSTCHCADGCALAPVGAAVMESRSRVQNSANALSLGLALSALLLQLLDEPVGQGDNAPLGRRRNRDRNRIDPDMEGIDMGHEYLCDPQRRVEDCDVGFAAGCRDEDGLLLS